MPHDPDQIRREDCRWSILTALNLRPTSAFNAGVIRTVLLKGQDYSQLEVEAALKYLEGASLVASIHDTLGGTRSYQITTAGVQHYERR